MGTTLMFAYFKEENISYIKMKDLKYLRAFHQKKKKKEISKSRNNITLHTI